MAGITIDSFMRALSGQESGGNYEATNKDSGAYGKFQIMPANWPSWSAEAGIPGAAPTPENQERVARFKIQQYFNKFGNWEDVAAAWYSGQPLNAETADRPQNGYPSIRSYVDSVVSRAGGSMSTSPTSGSTSYQPTGGGGGGSAPVDEFYAELLERRRAAYKAWISSLESGAYEDAYESPAYQAFVDATDEVEGYEAKYGKFGQGSATQQGFENRIALGDYEGRQADRAFNQWSKKTDLAYETAGGQIREAYDRNAARGKALDDMMNSAAPSLMPHPETTTYLAPRFDDALAKWKKKMGVGDQPGAPGPQAFDPFAGDPMTQPFVDPSAKFGGEGTPFAGDPMLKPRVDTTRLPGPFGVDIDLGPGARSPVAPGSPFAQSLNQITGAPAMPEMAFPSQAPKKKLASGARRISPSRWFARGTMNDEGGPAVVGEGGQPEFINVPGMGMVQVNQPTQVDLPEGADVIPANEMYQYSKLKQLAATPPTGSTPEEIQARRNDPDLEAKVRESLEKALAGSYAVDPPMTPMLEPGVPDLWGEFRGLTGTPAYPQPAQGGQ